MVRPANSFTRSTQPTKSIATTINPSEDFLRILTEPKASLTKQYTALLETEGVRLDFTPEALREMAEFAFRVNESTENIGARRLHTIMERVLEDVSFLAPDVARRVPDEEA